jgi:peptide/nickel transport system substrate-binding protein
VQAHALRIVTQIPLGEWHGFGAARDSIGTPPPLPPVMVFWGVSKQKTLAFAPACRSLR